MKKTISLLLVVAMLFTLDLFALAVENPVFNTRIVGTIDTNTRFGELGTFVVAWQIQANQPGWTLNNTQALRLAYDNTVLQLIRWDATNAFADSSIGTSFTTQSRAGNLGVYDSDIMQVFAAKNSSGDTGFLSLTLGDNGAVYTCTQDIYVALISVRFAFREEKSVEDLAPDSIRIMTAQELRDTSVSLAVLINAYQNGNSDTLTSYEYLIQQNGEPIGGDTLNPPAISLPALVNAQTPEIDIQPTGDIVVVGFTYDLTVSATSPDGGTLSYQWYSNTNVINSGGTLIQGATSATYTAPASIAGIYYYYVVVTNSIPNNSDGGTKTAIATSDIATVTVIKAQQDPLTINPVTDKTFGDAPFQLSTTGGSGTGAVTYTLVSGPATVTMSGLVTITGAGNIVVAATKLSDDNYEAITSAPLTIVVGKAQQATLTINPVTGKVYGDAPFQLNVTGGTTNGVVTYEVVSGPGSVTSSGMLTITGNGDIVVRATMAGNANYEDVVSANLIISVGKAQQAALTINPVTDKTFGDAPFQLSTTGGSGTSAVTYTLVSGPATVTMSGLVTITGAGSIVVTATKLSDDDYEAITSAPLTIVVDKAQQATLTITPVPGKVYGDAPFQLNITGGTTNGVVTYMVVSGPGSVTSSGMLTITGNGDIVIRATMAGNANYEDVVSANLIISVGKAQQAALTINSVPDKTFGDAPFQLSTTGGGGTGAVTYILVSGPATVTMSGLVTITGAGSIVVAATKLSDDNFEAITSAPLTIVVGKAQQATLTINPVPGKVYGDAPFQLNVTGGTTNGVVTYTLVSGPGTVTSSGILTITGNGDILVRATMAGNANYEDVVSANLIISVGKAQQDPLTINPVPDKTYGDTPFQLSTTGGSGTGAVTYTLVSGPATVTLSGLVTITGAGSIVVAATKLSDDNYEAINSAPLTIVVGKAQQATLTINPVTGKIYGDAPFQLSVTGGTTNGVVTYEVISGPGSVTSNGMLTITGNGDIVVNATMVGDANYEDVVSANLVISVGKAQQAPLTINPVPNRTYGDAPFQLSTKGGGGTGAVTYTLVSGPATITLSGLVTITGAGNIVVAATKLADDNYEAITSVPLIILVDKAQQELLTITPVSGKVYGDAPFQLSVTGGTTNGVVTYEVISGPGSVTFSGMLTITGNGDIVVKATMAGDANYEDVVSANLVISVGKAQQATLSINPVPDKTYGDAPFQLSTTGGSGMGAVTYTLVSGPATVTLSGFVTITGAGNIVVAATKLADDNYEAITSAPLTILVAVNKAELLAAIADFTTLIESDYTIASWVNLRTAYDAAVVVNDNPNTTQIAVNNAAETLRASIRALERVSGETVDRTGLAAAIAEYNALTQNQYTSASWFSARTAYDIAVSIYDNPNATQIQVNTVVDDLIAAMDALELIYLTLVPGQAPSFVIRKNMITRIRLNTNAESLIFVSSNPAIVSISQSGVIIGKSIGVAIVQVKDMNSGKLYNIVVNCTN